MIRLRRGGVIAVVAGLGVGVVAGVLIAPMASAQSTKGALISQNDVQRVWSETVSASKLVMPEGQSLPEQAPSFFQPADPKEVAYYEIGLFESIAQQYWRCSWLAVASDSSVSRAERSTASQQLAEFAQVQHAAPANELRAYQSAVAEAARATGEKPAQLEFNNDCEGVLSR